MGHDPLSAWFVVLAYAAGSLLALAAWQSAEEGRDRTFWLIAAFVLLFLGLNKQLDLQTNLTSFVRQLSRYQGWYESRRQVQGVFLLLIGFGAMAFSLMLATWLGGARASVKIAAAGLLMLAAFVFVRAAALHHIDLWVAIDLAGMRRSRWFELIGTGTVAVAAVSFWLHRPAAPN